MNGGFRPDLPQSSAECSARVAGAPLPQVWKSTAAGRCFKRLVTPQLEWSEPTGCSAISSLRLEAFQHWGRDAPATLAEHWAKQ
jgi:hypothetical protein